MFGTFGLKMLVAFFEWRISNFQKETFKPLQFNNQYKVHQVIKNKV